MGESFRYWAFISYSHADDAWGRWLHRALESYRVPRQIVGRVHPDGVIPARIFPVFRDRDELPSSAELGGVINAALRASRYQIVICSPKAAASRWVNEEIRQFKSFGRESRVFALIVDGEPNAGEASDPHHVECFPPALRCRVDTGGQLTAESTEPIAADARPGKDGRRGALLKIISGLLGVSLDELKQREKVRARWRMAGYAAATGMVTLMLAGVWGWQEDRRIEQARLERIERLGELGRKELENDQPARAAAYLGEAYHLGDASEGLRYQLAKTMRGVDPLLRVFVHSKNTNGNWTYASTSPDGTRLITCSNDRNVAVVWDADSGKELMQLDHGVWVGHVGYSPDGRLIYSSGEKEVRLWDAATGQRRAVIPGAAVPGAMLRVQFSEDSRRLLVRDGDGSVHVHDSRSGGRLAVIRGQSRAVAVEMTADGETLYTATENRVFLWRVHDAALKSSFTAHDTHVRDIDLSPDGRHLATTDLGGSVRLWAVPRGTLIAELRAAGTPGFLNFNPDGKRLALLGLDNSLSILPVPAPAGSGEPRARTAPGRWSEDGKWIAVENWSNTFRVWNAATALAYSTFGGHSEEIIAALFTPGAPRLLSFARDGTARLWQTGGAEMPLVRETGWLHDARYVASGRRWVALGSDGTIRERDAETGALVREVRGAHGLIQWGELAPEGTRAVVLVRDAQMELWDGTTAERIAELAGHRDEVRFGFTFDETGQWVVTYEASLGQVWSAQDGRRLLSLPATHPPRDDNLVFDWLAFAPDGRRLAIADGEQTIRIIEFPGGEIVRTLTPAGGAPRNLSWSKDGRLLSAADDAGLLTIWDISGDRVRQLETGTPTSGVIGTASVLSLTPDGLVLRNLDSGTTQLLAGHAARVNAIKLSPDGTRLATGSADTTIRLWDMQTGQLLDVLAGHYQTVRTLDFSPDGRRLLSADSTVRQWEMIPLELRTPAEIEAVLACKGPWRVRGDAVVPRAPDPGCFGVQ